MYACEKDGIAWKRDNHGVDRCIHQCHVTNVSCQVAWIRKKWEVHGCMSVVKISQQHPQPAVKFVKPHKMSTAPSTCFHSHIPLLYGFSKALRVGIALWIAIGSSAHCDLVAVLFILNRYAWLLLFIMDRAESRVY